VLSNPVGDAPNCHRVWCAPTVQFGCNGYDVAYVYDAPAPGRMSVRSDPIGLARGINTYAPFLPCSYFVPFLASCGTNPIGRFGGSGGVINARMASNNFLSCARVL
jgi:hypothetical protein